MEFVLFSLISTKFVAICNKPRIPRDISFCLTLRRAFSPLFKVFSVDLEGIEPLERWKKSCKG